LVVENERRLEEILKANKELVDEASIGMVNFIYDLTESAYLNVPSETEEAKDLDKAVDIIGAFVESDFASILAQPRVEREKDKVHFLPGQHKGIFISFVTSSHDLGNINIYGGLRDFHSPELKDTDVAMRTHHSKRTDSVLSQKVQFNFHVKDISGSSILDIWFTYNLGNGFYLDNLLLEGRKVDVHPTVDSSYPCFEKLKASFYTHTRTLVSLVPSV